ncbi:transporter substrate-binding domain-containing protein [Winogradskyella alexanderae]|uniref:Transporter substrate-binding domain-containing protein n=1 Tax=Winogradskyella alexanderae TaxID=2877123 RepID=A0ABS7XSW3_9FLAO|nr:transporter substrate-binding domain-containing protein [Winogradskyella alexanderae]MCA0133112.1 transporter substrate-binding domain-containing protein [Winogradskyella alexanderae]
MRKMLAYILTLSLLVLNSLQVFAQTDTLTVGIYQNPPFVIKSEGNNFEGLSIELWENIAKSSKLNFKYELHSDFISILKKLEYKEIDITINPMDVNDLRVEKFDMTQPYSISSIGVAIPYLNRSTFSVFVSNIFSIEFFEIILLLIFIIFVFGFFLWLVERKHNKFQFRPGLLGLFDGLWWSAVTMTTVGYGDKAPKTNQGKAIAIVWMFTAVIIISSFTAGIASTLTISGLQTDIHNAEDIRLVEKISTVGASNGEVYLNQEGISINQTYASPILALRAIAKKDNDVLLYDKSVLQYYINRLSLNEKVKLLPFTLKENYQSFMLPKNHKYFDKINVGLMKEIQKDHWIDLQRKYDVQEK